MSRRTALRLLPLDWSIAIVGAGILTCAFQGCATGSKPAESPSAESQSSGMGELGTMPEPAAAATVPVPGEESPHATLVASERETVAAESSTLPTFDKSIEPPDCSAYVQAQEPLARLGVAALSMGRIDPWIYDLDPRTKTLRMSASLGGVPAPAAKALEKALKKVNAQPAAAKLLGQAYSALTQPGSIMLCTPTKYDVVVKPISHTATGAAGYTWQFGEGQKPSDVQMVGCFEALYAKVPDACDAASYLETAAKCMTTHMGKLEDECESPAEIAAAAEAGAAAAGSASAAAAKRKCCDSCGRTYREKTDESCSSRSCF